ncbi:hypothetical protein ACSL103130_00210 [Actinomyces slackii]|uniref:Uncharacterized protein n=1 Tax=Actinomyces slackii TaxID=52774 RepID=A0A3S4SQS7_9ACTO|nr:hypothetical protein [Actinomyces slackii]VEG75571.1 Uncharacterised protein [Actinomyces slackii]
MADTTQRPEPQQEGSETTGARSGCRCGCGGHGGAQERAAAPRVAQPVGEGYERPEPSEVTDSSSGDDPTAATGSSAGGAQAPEASGVVPGRKAGNTLGLRDVSASATGGCGCGGHGHGHAHGRAHAHGRSGCGCGGH